MKNILIAAVFVFAGSAFAQSPEQFSDNANKAAEKLRETIVVREDVNQPGKFRAVRVRFTDAKWDVKKTDSLLTPVVAYVFVNQSAMVTDAYPSEEMAKSAEFMPTVVTSKVELTYTPTKQGWAISSAREYNDTLRRWFPVTEPKGPRFSSVWLAAETFAVR